MALAFERRRPQLAGAFSMENQLGGTINLLEDWRVAFSLAARLDLRAQQSWDSEKTFYQLRRQASCPMRPPGSNVVLVSVYPLPTRNALAGSVDRVTE